MGLMIIMIAITFVLPILPYRVSFKNVQFQFVNLRINFVSFFLFFFVFCFLFFLMSIITYSYSHTTHANQKLKICFDQMVRVELRHQVADYTGSKDESNKRLA